MDVVLARADIVSVNEREGAFMTDATEIDSIAEQLLGQVRPGASVVRGAAVDSNGAGDAHAGVLLAGLSRGLGLYEAALRANAAAALAVTERGPATAPIRSRTDALVGG